jgi:negative modulator of initiation of replication
MRTIEIDEDVYAYIASNTQEIGETASDILRRLLGLASGTTTEIMQTKASHELQEILESSKLRFQLSVVDKFLFILSEAYKQRTSDFEKILTIQGRDRLYFAKSRQEIEKSGNSTQPKQIPGTQYWVMTNSPTRQKAQMLRDALIAIGYSNEAARAAAQLIR